MRGPLALAAAISATILLCSSDVRSQETPCPPGPIVKTYRCEPAPNAFSSLAAVGIGIPILVAPADDVSVAFAFPPGFAFSFYCIPRAGVTVCSNGFLTFGAFSTSFTNEQPDDALLPNDAIFPWHDDLILALAVSTVVAFYDPIGMTLTFEWFLVENFPAGSGPAFSFQVVLYDSAHPMYPDAIEYRYDRSSGPGLGPCTSTLTAAPSATVGVEPNVGPVGLIFGGIDATERGAGNDAFPPCDVRLFPELPLAIPGYGAAFGPAPQEPWCSIVFLPGTVAAAPPCVAPCYDDDNSAYTAGMQIPLPWKFTLDGRVFKHANMNSNGYLCLGEGPFLANALNVVLPSAAEPDPILAPFWDDLEGGGIAGIPSGMFYRVDGAPGCRVMTFEWAFMGKKVGPGGDCIADGNISFQVKLFENSAGVLGPGCPHAILPGKGNDRIEYHYDHAGFVPPIGPPFTATIGHEDHVGLIGASTPGSPGEPGPPFSPIGPAKIVIDSCDFGTTRYYGDPSTNHALGCLPEIKTNCIAPIIGNGFGLQVVGATPAAASTLMIDFGALAGFKMPVPCGGLVFPGFGTFWVDIATAIFFSCGLTTPGGPCEGCCSVPLPIPPNPLFIGLPFYAQFLVVYPIPFPPFLGIELTEGAKIVIG